MKQEQQRIAIAEACGWKRTAAGKNSPWKFLRPNGQVCQFEDIPDYPGDLNAMGEAEKTLKRENGEVGKYAWKLEAVCGGTASAFFATAAQRAESFLKTIGKWTD